MIDDLGAAAWIAGRTLIGGIFLFAGVRHYPNLPGLTAALAARKVPLPRLALHAATALQIVCGGLLIIGWEVRWAAIGLIGFTLVSTVVLVDFWRMSGEARVLALNLWAAHLAIIGGLLLLASR